MKKYLAKTEYGNCEVTIKVDKYAINDSLAIQLIDANDGSPFAILTVNLQDTIANDYMQFVDVNNCPWAIKFIEENELGERITCYNQQSGFVTYPLYKFNLDKLKEEY